MSTKRVVITGIGALTAIGNNISSYWSALEKGVSGAAQITQFDASLFKTQFACELKGYNAADFFDRKEARKLDRFSQYAMVTADEAILDSGINQLENKERIGCIWGSGIGGLQSLQKDYEDFVTNDYKPRFSPFLVPKMIVDIVPGHISIKYGLKGLNFATVSACASSTNAIIDAYYYILLGKADAIVTGGSEAPIHETCVGGFSSMKALSTRNDDPAIASRPFDAQRDGFVVGEGSGCLILEDYDHAVKRGAKIYAEVAGAGMSADAHHITAPHPDGEGAARVMKLALEDAKITPDKIDYINVHGTSTPLGDIAEVKAIQQVFGAHTYELNISSTKSMTGHLLGGAGAIEALAVIYAIQKNMIPPTINHFEKDAALDEKINFTFNKAQQRNVHYALSNTFGFGGHNACVILKKYEQD